MQLSPPAPLPFGARRRRPSRPRARPPLAGRARAALCCVAAVAAGCTRDALNAPQSGRAIARDAFADLPAPALIGAGGATLGVGPLGQLDVGVLDLVLPGNKGPANLYGLRPAGGGAEAFGGNNEGWGVADGFTHAGGGFIAATGAINLDLESFSSTASTATSVGRIAGTFRVTHDFHPSTQTPALYEIVVTVENTGGAATDVHYRRNVHWTPGVASPAGWPPLNVPNYVVTSVGSHQPQVERVASDDCPDVSPLPLAAGPRAGWWGYGDSGCQTTYGDFQVTANDDPDTGGLQPDPIYDFALGPLGPGAKLQFRLYYGAGSGPALLAALAAAGVKTYSTATANATTFVFGFAPAAQGNHLIVVRDSGVVGAPAPAGGDTTVAEQSIPYQFALAPGYRNLVVLLDGRPVPASGTVAMDSGRVLIASADRIPVVGDAAPLVAALRAVLTSPNPVRAYQDYLDLTAVYASQHAGADLIDRLRDVEFAAVDPVADAAAIARVDAALAGHEFDLTRVAGGVVASHAPLADRALTSGSARDRVTVRFVNGIFNGEGGAAGSARALNGLVSEVPGLADGLATRDTRVTYFYNRTVWDQNVLARCFALLGGRQTLLGTASRAAFFPVCVGTAPLRGFWEFDLTESARQYANLRGWAGTTGTQSPDVNALADVIASDRVAGRHEILVPHSQGNLLVGQALAQLAQDGRYVPASDPYCVGIVSLAAPTRAGLQSAVPGDQLGFVAVRGDLVVNIGNTPTLDNALTTQLDAEIARLKRQAQQPLSSLGVRTIYALIAEKQILWGLRIHEVQGSYFEQASSHTAVVNTLSGVYRGCAVDRATLTPSSIVAAPRTQTALALTLLNGFGRPLPARPVAWFSDAPDVARVGQTGVVTTNRPGTATVMGATSEGWGGSIGVTVSDP